MSSSKHHKIKSMGGGLYGHLRESSQEMRPMQKKSGCKEKNYSTTRGEDESLRQFTHQLRDGMNDSFTHTQQQAGARAGASRKGGNQSIATGDQNNNLSHLTNNFINISLDKNPQKVLSNLFITNEGLQGDINNIEKRILEFLDDNTDMLERDGVITAYVEKFIELLSTLGESFKKFEGMFDKIKIGIHGPFGKMMEHFIEVRDVIMEQNVRLEEFELLRQRNEQLEHQINMLIRENEKMESQKSQLSQYIFESKNLDLREIERIFQENNKLKLSISKQKKLMNETRQKEEKVMRLLYAIRKKGIDIEEIYNECVKTPAEEVNFIFFLCDSNN
jgi:hypothetical protein